MKRLLYAITRAEPGGAQGHLRYLLQGFSGQFELHLAVGQEDWLSQEARSLGVEVHLLDRLVQPLAPARDAGAVWQLVRLLRRLRPDLLHCHSSKAGLLGRLAARLTGVPAVFTAHGWAFAEGAGWPKRAVAIPSEWLAARLGQPIICVSSYDYQLALRHKTARASQMQLVHNGIPDQPPPSLPRPDPPEIVMVARFSPPKNQLLLLQALSGLRGLDWRLNLVGDGPLLPQARQEAARLNLGGRVRFWGSRQDIPQILAQNSIFALITSHEGLPLSTLEAMRAGLPVVASAVGGVPELVQDGQTGFLAPHGDLAVTRERLALLIQTPALRERMGQAGRARFQAGFTLEAMLQKTLEVYRSALKEQS